MLDPTAYRGVPEAAGSGSVDHIADAAGNFTKVKRVVLLKRG